MQTSSGLCNNSLFIELSRDTGEALDKDVYTYTNFVGSMLYMSVCIRPDIAQAVGALSKFMAAPTTTHWQAATGVLRYLAGSKYELNFPSEDLEGTGHARAGALYQEPLFDASTAPPPPVSAPTVKGFFPHLRWVFYAELISEPLTRQKTAAGVTDLVAVWRPGAKRRMKRRPLRS